MNILFESMRDHALSRPSAVAMDDGRQSLSYGALVAQVDALADQLAAWRPHAVALLADNGVDWVLADLAATRAGIPVVPLPLFFSPDQMAHVMAQSGADLLLAAPEFDAQVPALFPRFDDLAEARVGALRVFRSSAAAAALPLGTAKITFTSGTTGTPKGVCLGAAPMANVARALAQASEARHDDRHLCVLPLATLLENVGGVYAGLIAGACVCVPPLAEVGLSGSSGLDVMALIHAIERWQASTLILVPQLLQAVLTVARQGRTLPKHLRFVALGGAPVSPRLLAEADAAGLPVFEGYGLSECASVVALNTRTAQRPGSVGRPLPHVRVRVADDGEIHVRGASALGYLGAAEEGLPGEVATGDLGYLDADGYLYLSGRKKHIFITAFGRNVAPDWVEREMLGEPEILQAAVFGEARPFNCAVLVPMPGASAEAVGRAMLRANARLPDYARVQHWIHAVTPFTHANGLGTANGRVRRERIAHEYAASIEALYTH